MKNKLKVYFIGLYPYWTLENNFFVWVLKHYYDLEITADNPEIVFVIDQVVPKYQNAKMIYFTGEPWVKIHHYDISLTQFEVDRNSFIRLPLYLLYAYDLLQANIIKSFNSVCMRNNARENFQHKTKFCSFLARWGGENNKRDELVKLITNYKDVDCAGSHLNNYPLVPEGSLNKIQFLKHYKFNIAVESYSSIDGYIGYTSEKIYEPMIADCIPIYFGNPDIKKDFNELTFINVRDYSNDQLLQHIIEIDTNDDLYLDYLLQPYTLNNDYFNIEFLIELFKNFL